MTCSNLSAAVPWWFEVRLSNPPSKNLPNLAVAISKAMPAFSKMWTNVAHFQGPATKNPGMVQLFLNHPLVGTLTICFPAAQNQIGSVMSLPTLKSGGW